MKKILIITGSWPPALCGVGIYSERFYSYISSNKHLDISVLTSSEFMPVDLQAYSTPAWRISDLPKILKAIKLANPEIVHVQYPTLPYKRQLGINLLALFLRFRRRFVVITLHEYFQTSLLGKIRTLLTIIPANIVVVSNEADARSLPGFLRNKIKTIPISSTVAAGKPSKSRAQEILKASGLSLDKQTVIFFGLPFRNKRLDLLIEAAGKFSGILQLLLVFNDRSDDPYVKEVLDAVYVARRKGANIGLAGFLNDSDLSVALHESKYFVLPQTNPPLTAKSGTTIAAALHGCVVVAAEPRPSDLSIPFVSGKNCVLLKNMTPDSLTRTLNELSANPNEQTRLRGNAEKLADYFNWAAIVDKYAKLYSGEY